MRAHLPLIPEQETSSVLPLTGPGMHGPLGLPPLLTARKEADLADQGPDQQAPGWSFPPEADRSQIPAPSHPPGWESQDCPSASTLNLQKAQA